MAAAHKTNQASERGGAGGDPAYHTMHCISSAADETWATKSHCSNKKLVAVPTAEHSTQERNSVGQTRLARCLYLCMGAHCPAQTYAHTLVLK
jgi:hypothetical protein